MNNHLDRIALLLLMLLVAAHHPLRAERPELSWRFSSNPTPTTDCEPDSSVELSCGTFGTYRLATQPSAPDCDASARNSEQPAAFIPPASWPEPDTDNWFPCRAGQCFTSRASGPWVAVIDWHDAHGWSVGHTILQAADFALEVELYPVDQPAPGLAQVLDAFPTGEAHLLTQLCALADRIADEPDLPPLAVNISAGRFVGGPISGDAVPNLLTYQIGALIEHLATDYDIAFVGAAGHHRHNLFPATLDAVLDVGTLNLSKLRSLDEPRHSWLTDREAHAIFPGHGLALTSQQADQCWPAPPGSSYASALAAGWIAAYRMAGGGWLVGDAKAAWRPHASGDRFRLSRDSATLEGTDFDGPNTLIRGAIEGGACPSGPASEPMNVTLGPAEVDPLRWLPSLPEMVHQFGPSPSNDPCVPCEIPPRITSQAARLQLGNSHPLPVGHEILAIYLLIGGDYHPLEASNQGEFLRRLETGDLPAVTIDGFDDRYAHPWDEALLVYVLGLDDRAFWTSAPINVLP